METLEYNLNYKIVKKEEANFGEDILYLVDDNFRPKYLFFISDLIDSKNFKDVFINNCY